MNSIVKRYFAISILTVASLSPLKGVDAQTPAGSVLTFQPDQANLRFEILLKRAIAPTVDNQIVLNGTALGAITLQTNLDFSQRIDTYQWTISPTSRLYLSPSGYKSLIAKYQYTEGGESHTLNISCQTRVIRSNKAFCKLFGDGPLLNGETKAVGKLTINQATNNNGFAPSSSSGAYRRGYELGLLDAKQKLDRNYARHRTEYEGPEETDFRRGYENAYGNINSTGSPGDNVTGGYAGKGALSLYPTKTKPQEQRYDLARIVLKTGANATGYLTLLTHASGKTVEFKGKLETVSGGQTLDIAAMDGVPAQGKILMGNNGLLRVITPILVGSEDQEVSLYFRPN